MASNLPVEVVTHIMKYLGVSDRKEASLVNRTWYEASLDPILQRDLVVTFSSSRKCDDPITDFGRRRNPNVILDQLDGSSRSKELLLKSCQHMGPNLQMVSFRGSDITENIFFSFLIHCNSLIKLDLSCCNALFMSGKLLEKEMDRSKLKHVLKHLKELNLSSIRQISDETFNRITSVAPGLEVLSLELCTLWFQSTAYLSRGRGASRNSGSSNILSFDNLVNYLKQQCPTFKSINLSRTAINDESLEVLAEIPGLYLKELHLDTCKELTDKGLACALRKQTKLEVVDCRSCSEVGNGTIMAITEHLPNIRQINLRQCLRITDTSVAGLCNIPSIRKLDLSPCHDVTTKGLILGLSSPTISGLTQLSLNGCNAVSDKFVFSMSGVLKNLEKLDLSSCFSITDVSVHAISKNLKYLTHLNLGWCKHITDAGLLGLVNDKILKHEHDALCKCMRKMDKSDVFKFYHPTMAKIDPVPVLLNEKEIKELQRQQQEEGQIYPISNLARLQVLNLEAIPSITDISLTQVITFKELRTLNLTMCKKLSDATLFRIATGAPSLEELSIGQCTKITDNGLYLVLKSLQRLTSLHVTSCDLLTDKTVSRIAEKCKRLRHLDVSFCSLITEEAMDVLESHLQHLTDVKKRYITMAEYVMV
ncbi:F-box/LRR-repeat protein fbxl-1-like [Lineus longissimus]|uniref:F-box/LRR-repeat protein fbxl-1-like n=1 Tax=Lineus longissimus TaxID=88925 RepID=UPI00315D93B0